MKKIISAVLITVMLAVMSMAMGCQNGSVETVTTPTGSETAATENTGSTYVDGLGEVKADKSYKFGFSISARDKFLSYLETAWVAECYNLGVEQTVIDANNNANTQLSNVQSFAAQGMDGIVVNLVNTDKSAEIIAAAKGIPVVFVNRAPAVEL